MTLYQIDPNLAEDDPFRELFQSWVDVEAILPATIDEEELINAALEAIKAALKGDT